MEPWHRSLPREHPKLVPRCPRCELPTLPMLTACRWCGQILAIDSCDFAASVVPAETVSDGPFAAD